MRDQLQAEIERHDRLCHLDRRYDTCKWRIGEHLGDGGCGELGPWLHQCLHLDSKPRCRGRSCTHLHEQCCITVVEVLTEDARCQLHHLAWSRHFANSLLVAFATRDAHSVERFEQQV